MPPALFLTPPCKVTIRIDFFYKYFLVVGFVVVVVVVVVVTFAVVLEIQASLSENLR